MRKSKKTKPAACCVRAIMTTITTLRRCAQGRHRPRHHHRHRDRRVHSHKSAAYLLGYFARAGTQNSGLGKKERVKTQKREVSRTFCSGNGLFDRQTETDRQPETTTERERERERDSERYHSTSFSFVAVWRRCKRILKRHSSRQRACDAKRRGVISVQSAHRVRERTWMDVSHVATYSIHHDNLSLSPSLITRLDNHRSRQGDQARAGCRPGWLRRRVRSASTGIV